MNNQFREWLAVKVRNAEKCRESGDHEKVVDIYTEVLSICESAEFRHQRALAHSALGDYSMAKLDLDAAIEIRPLEPDHYVNRGNSLLAMGRSEAARDDFKRAIEISGTCKQAFNGLGATFEAEGLVHRAAVAYENALAIDSQYLSALKNLRRLRNESAKKQRC